MTTLKEKTRDSSLFRKIYTIDLLFCTISFLQIAAYVLLVLLFIWGVYLTFYNQKKNKTIFTFSFGIWINAFLIISLLSIFINLSVTFFYSLVMFLHIAICFVIFYGMHTEPGFNFRLELYQIATTVVYIVTAANIIGIFCLLIDFRFEWYWIKFTIYENRFTGIYVNPNNLGFTSVAALAFCHILYKKSFIDRVKKPAVNRILLALCGLTSLFSLLLCDSNAAIVLGIAYVFVYIVCRFFANPPTTRKKLVVKLGSLILIGVFLVGATLFIRTICQAGFSVVVSKTTSIVSLLNDSTQNNLAPDGTQKQQNQKPTEPSSSVTFSHKNKNIDSGRTKLWKESLDLFKLSPVIGISNGNIVLYSQEYLNGALSYSYHHNDLHNGFLTLLVSTGVIGFLLFAIFGLRFIISVSRVLFMRKNSFYSDDALPCIFSFLFAYLFYAVFEKALLYDISFTVILFWLMMGYASCYIKKYKHHDDWLNIKDLIAKYSNPQKGKKTSEPTDITGRQ